MSSGRKEGFGKQNLTGKKLDDQYGQRKGCTRSCDFRLPKRYELVSPMKYLKHAVEKVAAVVARMVATKSSSHRNHIKERAKPSVAPVLDSQRAEAIDDCIDFIKSSSSLSISNSNSISRN
ncbi:hypothetical protein ABFX02_14G076300 [Erythranthe guttata]